MLIRDTTISGRIWRASRRPGPLTRRLNRFPLWLNWPRLGSILGSGVPFGGFPCRRSIPYPNSSIPKRRCARKPSRFIRRLHAAAIPRARSSTGRSMIARSTALCLSGGGIRSASFALGVIEALAVHPRPASNQQAPSEDQIAAEPIQLSVHRLGRRLHRQLAIGVHRARRLSGSLEDARRLPPVSGRRAVRDRVAALLQQLPDAQNRAVLRRHLGRDIALRPQSDAELAGHPAGVVPRAVRREDRSHRGILGFVAAAWTIPRWFIVAGVIAMVIALAVCAALSPQPRPGHDQERSIRSLWPA